MSFNWIIGVITIAFPILFLPYALKFPAARTAGLLGPGFWPTAILSLMFILSVMLLVQTYKNKVEKNKKDEVMADKSEKMEKEFFESKIVYPNRYLIIILLLLLYALFINYVGFLIATPLLILSSAWVLGMRRWTHLVLMTVVSSIVVIYVFAIFLEIPLPRGFGVFRNISLWFY